MFSKRYTLPNMIIQQHIDIDKWKATNLERKCILSSLSKYSILSFDRKAGGRWFQKVGALTTKAWQPSSKWAKRGTPRVNNVTKLASTLSEQFWTIFIVTYVICHQNILTWFLGLYYSFFMYNHISIGSLNILIFRAMRLRSEKP